MSLTPTQTRHSTSSPWGVIQRRPLDPVQLRALLDLVKTIWEESAESSEAMGYERRRAHRQFYAQPIVVTPCPDVEQPRIDESEIVLAKDISDTGLSFVSSHPPRHEQILITFSMDEPMPTCLLANVRHACPTKRGKYVVGVQFLQRVHLVSLEDFGNAEDGTELGNAE